MTVGVIVGLADVPSATPAQHEAVRSEHPLVAWYKSRPGAKPLPEDWALEMDEAVRPSDQELQVRPAR